MSRASEENDVETIREMLREFYAAAIENDHPCLRLDAEEVPAGMAEDVEDDGSVLWKMIPSTTSPAEIRRLESGLRCPLPPMYRAYLRSYFHLFEHLVAFDSSHGKGGVGFARMTPDDPFPTFRHANGELASSFEAGLARRLFDLGFLLIGWSIHDRLAFDTHFSDAEGDYEIVAISHALGDEFFESITSPPLPFELEDVSLHTQPVCDSFRKLVDVYFRYPVR
ncbi:hypothetical protein [Lignipirellula cremea]|uniref:Knr4/Smi1-like domain-containing protein n=1 Tax=Lignipirellula cremea TaxID=2528010 RepID=A0A518E0M1_9BACT|nr:hypothetical protein [Lignipirellula cremea]QDU97644.1 hypothetical protein Pla8534_54950 [Lignipirellula cremea]